MTLIGQELYLINHIGFLMTAICIIEHLEVMIAIDKLKNRIKETAVYNSLSANNFKYALLNSPCIFYTTFFYSILIHGVIPDDFSTVTILPILKVKNANVNLTPIIILVLPSALFFAKYSKRM